MITKRGLSLDEVEVLANTDKPEAIQQIFQTAARIKQEIYGERLVLFAPLYVSDYCVNDCAYCNFHASNLLHKRRRLTMEEIAAETKCLIDMGHKRVLVEFGEDPEFNNIDYICRAIRTIYSVGCPTLVGTNAPTKVGRPDFEIDSKSNIRRVNVNIAATTVEDYRRLKAENIGTYQLFQETYHRPTYEALHKGPKADYDRQLTAHNRAHEAGLDDLGIGVLFGLYDWRYEVLELVKHAQRMERELGVGPHTISVPRFRPAPDVDFKPAHPVSDDDFLKLIAILRIAVPYTGMILSTREPPELRRKAFQLGISQASAASICVPGGYFESRKIPPVPPFSKRGRSNVPPFAKGGEGGFSGQFQTQDLRSLNEVVNSIIADGLIPSFCTACYRSGRTGDKFMKLAKSGSIHEFCRPNALLTFAEYLEDYGDAETKATGFTLIKKYLNEILDPKIQEQTRKRLKNIKSGKRDIYF